MWGRGLQRQRRRRQQPRPAGRRRSWGSSSHAGLSLLLLLLLGAVALQSSQAAEEGAAVGLAGAAEAAAAAAEARAASVGEVVAPSKDDALGESDKAATAAGEGLEGGTLLEEGEEEGDPAAAQGPTAPPAPSPANQGSNGRQKSVREILALAGRRALGGGIPGAAAGALQVLALMWLRTITNFQYRYGGNFASAASALYKQGGFYRFYDGVGFALIQGPLSRFGSTAANDGCRALLKNLEATRGLPLFVSTALASVAAGAWRVLLMPIDTSKTVLQVEGHEGFRSLVRRVFKHGEVSALYQGAAATAVGAASGHLPWFYTYGWLDERLARPEGKVGFLCRNALIGFVASAVSDTLTNAIRVVKTTKQAAASMSSLSYAQTVQIILAADGGWQGLFGRGLSTRIMTNGLQSILFTIIWNGLKESRLFRVQEVHDMDQDDDDAKQTLVLEPLSEGEDAQAEGGGGGVGEGGMGSQHHHIRGAP